MSMRINGLNLSVRRIIQPSSRPPQQPQRGLEKSRNPEAARKRVANLLQAGRRLTAKPSKAWKLAAKSVEGVCGRLDQHKGILVGRFQIQQAARNGWNYTQAACRWGCSCLDVIESIAVHADIGIAQDNTIFVIPKPEVNNAPAV